MRPHLSLAGSTCVKFRLVPSDERIGKLMPETGSPFEVSGSVMSRLVIRTIALDPSRQRDTERESERSPPHSLRNPNSESRLEHGTTITLFWTRPSEPTAISARPRLRLTALGRSTREGDSRFSRQRVGFRRRPRTHPSVDLFLCAAVGAGFFLIIRFGLTGRNGKVRAVVVDLGRDVEGSFGGSFLSKSRDLVWGVWSWVDAELPF
ncbi:hypothetical protein BHE74_00000509 [Ensete ventricosum]|nr:hypothetical protein BHE74_00000509 [Ensete ventricosum]